jgi:hypothetical protein
MYLLDTVSLGISEGNRIFGFDGWGRETVESRCVLARENRGAFLAVYTARVRISVQAGGTTIVREGHGSGEGRGASPGEVHDTALKAAETDATKRALATFGKPFGLALYGAGKSPPIQPEMPLQSGPAEPVQRFGFHPMTQHRFHAIALVRPQPLCAVDGPAAKKFSRPQKQTSSPPPLVPNGLDSRFRSDRLEPTHHCRAQRPRDKAHLKFVASQPCLICGRQPSDPHHLRFAQPRGIGLKVSDEFTVPLCRGHHRQLHHAANEVGWWENLQIDALGIAKDLWKQTLTKHGQVDAQTQSMTINATETTAKI